MCSCIFSIFQCMLMSHPHYVSGCVYFTYCFLPLTLTLLLFSLCVLLFLSFCNHLANINVPFVSQVVCKSIFPKITPHFVAIQWILASLLQPAWRHPIQTPNPLVTFWNNTFEVTKWYFCHVYVVLLKLYTWFLCMIIYTGQYPQHYVLIHQYNFHSELSFIPGL